MASNAKDPVLVTVQLSGGNDYLNTVIPFNDPLYRDNRPGGRDPRRPDPALRQELRHSIRRWPR